MPAAHSRDLTPSSANSRGGKSLKGRRPGAKNEVDTSDAATDGLRGRGRHGVLPAALFRIDEAAEILNISPKTLRNRISLGQIAVYRIGRGIRISEETLQEILDRAYVPARA